MRPSQSDLWVFGPGAPGLDNAMELADSMESYRNLLARLIKDEPFRRERGRRVQEQILSRHTEHWMNTVHNLYEKVHQYNGRGCLVEKNDNFQPGDLNLALERLWGRQSFRMRSLIGKFIGTLPYRSRVALTWRLYRQGLDLCLLNLIPPRTEAAIRSAGRWAEKSFAT